MTRSIRAAVVALVALAALAWADTAELKGQEAPRIRLDTLNGYHFDSDKLRCKVVLYEFWSSHCGACRASLPLLQQVYDWIDDEELDAAVYPIHLEGSAEDVRACWSDLKLSMPTLMDVESKVFKSYRCNSYPLLVAVVNGTVREVHAGYSPTLGEYAEDLIRSLLQS